MYTPKVNADGNELGGVPVVLFDAPLGTYLGWNLTEVGAKPFYKGDICKDVGGMALIATTAAERQTKTTPACRCKSDMARATAMCKPCVKPLNAPRKKASSCP